MDVDVRIHFPEPPAFAEAAPTRAVYVGDAAGRCEIFAWDTRAGTARQITDRPQGTVTCAIDPSGHDVWWFDDDLGGVGSWRVRAFDGGADRSADLPAGRAAGLAMAADGTVAAGIEDDDGLTVYLRRPGEPARPVERIAGHASVVDLADSGRLLAVAGDPESVTAVLLLDLANGERTVLSGVGNPVWPAGFAPGGERLLLTVGDGDGYRLAVWDRESGSTSAGRVGDTEIGPAFDTEIAPSWYPDGERILVRQDRHARSILHEVDPAADVSTVLDTPDGTILAARVQPDGDLHYVWTDSTRPPTLRTASGTRPPGRERRDVQPGARAEVWVDTQAGPVHTLLTVPDVAGPYPTVVLAHGGPHDAARDAYDALVSVFVSIGCAVARPNYRGSTGYGAAWRDAVAGDEGVGLTQLHDLAAVRAHLVASGLADAQRIAVCGESWGGYLALLAAGVQPDLWQAVASVNPIADYAAAFRDTTEAVRAMDVRLFGGDPDECPQAYAAASPSTYVDAVRAPVLIVAATDDERCPPGQVADYAEALRLRGLPPELLWTRSGHEGHEIDVHVQMLATVVRFVGTALGGRPASAPADAG